jgi:hypothetical protein
MVGPISALDLTLYITDTDLVSNCPSAVFVRRPLGTCAARDWMTDISLL